MKKFLLITSLMFLSLAPAFSAAWELQQARQEYTQGAYKKCLSTLNTAIANSTYKDPEMYRLRAKTYMKMNSPVSAIKDFDVVIDLKPTPENYNERAYANLKAQNYDNAVNDFSKTIDKTNKGKYAIKGLKIIANDNNISLDYRVAALYYLSCCYEGLYGKTSTECMISNFKIAQFIANADENDEIFKEKSKTKKEIIDEFRKKVSERTVEEDEACILGEEIAQGYFEYALGNKELGRKIVYGAINEMKSRKDFTLQEIQDHENTSIKIFKALDAPGI